MKPDTISPILYDCNDIKCPEWANPWRQKADKWLSRDGAD